MSAASTRWAALGALLFATGVLRGDDAPADSKSAARPEIADKRPEQLFKELDQDGDGKLTAEEIPEERRPFFDHLLRVGDKDKDSELTQSEFLEGLKPVERRPAAGGDASNPEAMRGFDPERVFRRLDRNGDGKLAADEVPEPMRERMKPIYERLKKNELTREEFVEASRRMGGPGGLAGGMPQNPARMDRNGDGKISADEVPEPARRWFERMLEQSGKPKDGALSLDEVRSLQARMAGMPPGGGALSNFRPGGGPAFLRKLDRNGDGRISRDELKAAGDLFEEFDRDRDGALDIRELMGGPEAPTGDEPQRQPEPGIPGAKPGSPAAAPAADSAKSNGRGPLRRLDANGDGRVSRDEAQGRLKRNFEKFDRNSDGFLDRDEVRRALDDVRPGQKAGSNDA